MKVVSKFQTTQQLGALRIRHLGPVVRAKYTDHTHKL